MQHLSIPVRLSSNQYHDDYCPVSLELADITFSVWNIHGRNDELDLMHLAQQTDCIVQ